MQPEHDYEVGYKKPPKETQFKKGQSGNRKRRPRPAKTLGKALSEILDQKLTITENGCTREISKIDAILTQLANKAAQGDPKATQEIFRMIETFHRYRSAQGSNDSPAARDPAVRLILRDNGYGLPQDSELIRRLVKTQREWEIERERKRNPGNDNFDDSVWKLQTG